MTFFNDNFVTTTSRVTEDGKYPEWYLPPGYRIEWNISDEEYSDLEEDYCYFVAQLKFLTWNDLPTSASDNDSLEILGLVPNTTDSYVYKAKFQWDNSAASSLSWLLDVYKFSKVSESIKNGLSNGRWAFRSSKITSVYAIENHVETKFSTSNLTDMSYMFYGAQLFNQSLNFNTSTENDVITTTGFDTSNATNMDYMFYDARVFNQPLDFDTSNVTNMESMFEEATAFNQPLDFDTSNVTTMESMFKEATAFNQPLDYVEWTTSNVTTMRNMFYLATAFNQPLDWDTNDVTNMNQMFEGAEAFNQPINFSDTSSVTSMIGMFSNAKAFDQSLDFDTSSVTSMNGMFSGAYSFNQSLDFDTSNVVNMFGMFSNAKAFNQSLDFDTSSVTDMGFMFYLAAAFDQDISRWCVTNIPIKPDRFDIGAGFEGKTANQPQWGLICVWDINEQDYSQLDQDYCYFVSDTTSLTWNNVPTHDSDNSSLQILGRVHKTTDSYVYRAKFKWDNSNSKSLSWLLDVYKFSKVSPNVENGLSSGRLAFYFSKITSVYAIENSSTTGFDTSNLTDMFGMFLFAKNFNQPLDFDTGNVTDMTYMFSGALVFNQPLNLSDTSSVTSMENMFRETIAFNQPLNFDTSSVTNMGSMFNRAEAFNKPLNFNTSSVTSMIFMFNDAYAFNQNISGWCVSQIASKPYWFDKDSAFENQTAKQPQWGQTC